MTCDEEMTTSSKRLEVENDCHPTNLKHIVFCLDTWGDARCTKIDFKAYVSSVWFNQLLAGLIGRHICILPRSHVSLKLLPGPGLILAAAEPISKPQVRKDGSFFGRCVSCIRFLPCQTSSESLSKLDPKDFMPAWFYMNLASSKLDFGCKHLLRFAKPRLLKRT